MYTCIHIHMLTCAITYTQVCIAHTQMYTILQTSHVLDLSEGLWFFLNPNPHSVSLLTYVKRRTLEVLTSSPAALRLPLTNLVFFFLSLCNLRNFYFLLHIYNQTPQRSLIYILLQAPVVCSHFPPPFHSSSANNTKTKIQVIQYLGHGHLRKHRGLIGTRGTQLEGRGENSRN